MIQLVFSGHDDFDFFNLAGQFHEMFLKHVTSFDNNCQLIQNKEKYNFKLVPSSSFSSHVPKLIAHLALASHC